MKQKPLYIFSLFLSGLLAVIALGGGLFGQPEPWFAQWQHKLFAGLCHQLPDRSFWIGGQPMAVCARCFGVYSGFFFGLISGPFFSKIIRTSFLKNLLLVTVILNIVDVIGNIAGFWTNTLLSRFVLGFILTLPAGLMLGRTLSNKK